MRRVLLRQSRTVSLQPCATWTGRSCRSSFAVGRDVFEHSTVGMACNQTDAARGIGWSCKQRSIGTLTRFDGRL